VNWVYSGKERREKGKKGERGNNYIKFTNCNDVFGDGFVHEKKKKVGVEGEPSRD